MDTLHCKTGSGGKQVGTDKEKGRVSSSEAKLRTVTVIKKSPSRSPPPAPRSTITIKLWVSLTQYFLFIRIVICILIRAHLQKLLWSHVLKLLLSTALTLAGSSTTAAHKQTNLLHISICPGPSSWKACTLRMRLYKLKGGA